MGKLLELFGSCLGIIISIISGIVSLGVVIVGLISIVASTSIVAAIILVLGIIVFLFVILL